MLAKEAPEVPQRNACLQCLDASILRLDMLFALCIIQFDLQRRRNQRNKQKSGLQSGWVSSCNSLSIGRSNGQSLNNGHYHLQRAKWPHHFPFAWSPFHSLMAGIQMMMVLVDTFINGDQWPKWPNDGATTKVSVCMCTLMQWTKWEWVRAQWASKVSFSLSSYSLLILLFSIEWSQNHHLQHPCIKELIQKWKQTFGTDFVCWCWESAIKSGSNEKPMQRALHEKAPTASNFRPTTEMTVMVCVGLKSSIAINKVLKSLKCKLTRQFCWITDT